MKKEYVNPQMVVVKLATMTVLAGSPKITNNEATSTDGDYDDNASLFTDFGSNEDW